MKVTVMKIRITGALLYVPVLPAGLTLMKHGKGEGKSKVLNDLKRHIVFGGAIGTLAGFAQIALYLDSYHHFFLAIGVILLPAFYAFVLYSIIDTFT